MSQELVAELDELLKEYDGSYISDDTLLVDSGIDSFGVAMVLLEIDTKYGCYPKESEDKIDYSTFTLGNIIEDISKCI